MAMPSDDISRKRSRHLRVAHVALGLQIGGLEMVIANLFNGLDKARFEQHVYCLDEEGPLTKTISEHGGRVTLLKRHIPLDWSLPWRLARLARRDKVDVLHAHNFTPFFYGSLGGWLSRIPVVVTFHNTQLAGWPRKRVAALRTLSTMAAGVIAVSQQTQAAIRSLLPKATRAPICHIANGIDLRRFRPRSPDERAAIRRRLGLWQDARIIGSVGRLSHEKDYATLIHAYAVLRREDASVRLVLAGDGPERTALQHLVGDLGLQGDVMFLGSCSEVEDVLSAFDLFALPSITEGASLALLEAMASGLPVVATRVGGTVDLIDDGVNGVLCGSRDAIGLAEALKTVLRKTPFATTLGCNARTKVASCYSLEAMTEAYGALYRRVSQVTT